MKLEDHISTLSGIGPKKSAELEAVGIRTIEDLLWFLPKKYEDRNRMGTLTQAEQEPVTVAAVVSGLGTIVKTRKGIKLFILPIEETAPDGRLIQGEALFFNQPWLANAFKVGESYLFYGRVKVTGHRRQILAPQFAPLAQKDRFSAITPIYGHVEGISSDRLSKLIAQVLDDFENFPDPLPSEIKKEYGLVSVAQLLESLHRPKNGEAVLSARYRLKFEEALQINLGILSNHPRRQNTKVRIHNFSKLKAFEANLPFPLTEGQISVLEDIISDLRQNRTMNRLVQGDVGSGKTIIAVACAYLFALAGYQTAYMAPTEILAEQHAKNFEAFLKAYDIPVVLLTGSMKTHKRKAILEDIASGSARVIIGTHALIQSDVDYYNLGLVITDEQHRFGVRQRGRLGLKGTHPHTLVMSATPIPRTLSLVFYGDLDVSVITTMPEGRKPVKTYFYGTKALSKIYDFISKECDKGYQALVVCPFVEASEMMTEVLDTERAFEAITAYFKHRYRVGCLHGRMSENEKAEIINAYTEKDLQILVATSIVEVGIDVPDISVMVILSAERFGLSQLHQLRGRAGRGSQQAYCFLVSDQRSDTTLERMKVIVNHQNGQEIAEEDYRLRGPGDYFGSRQHGFPDLKALDPYIDQDLIAETRRLAEKMMQSTQKSDMIYRASALEQFYRGIEIGMN